MAKNSTSFKKGESGNPGGKPKHARNRLANSLLTALADDFDKHGIASIKALRESAPDKYLAICVSVLPKQVEIEETRTAYVIEVPAKAESNETWLQQHSPKSLPKH
jgi:hypothetical protein